MPSLSVLSELPGHPSVPEPTALDCQYLLCMFPRQVGSPLWARVPSPPSDISTHTEHPEVQQGQIERMCLFGKGRKEEGRGGKRRVKEKDSARPDQEPFHHGKRHKFLHFPFRTGKALCCHFTWQRVGNGSCPYDRSALHKDKNTRICFTISILVPCRKGYFRLNFEGLLKAGTLQCSQAV